MNKRHPYELRNRIRAILPWFLIDLGVADKGENCELVNANHDEYNIDGQISGCYYCKQTFPKNKKDRIDPETLKNVEKLKSHQRKLENLMSGLNFVSTFNYIELGHANIQADLWMLIQKTFKDELEKESQLVNIKEEELWEKISEAFAYRGDKHSGFQLSSIEEENYSELQEEYKLELQKLIEQSRSIYYLSNLRGNMYYPVFWDFNLVFDINNNWYIVYGLASD